MNRRAKLYPLTPEITCIDDAGDSVCYVVCGKDKAAVIDTVNGMENLKDIVREITDLPLVVINTHGHCDHIYGNTYFEEAYLHPADWALHDAHFAMKAQTTPEEAVQFGATPQELRAYIEAAPCPLKPIEAGELIDLGGKTLEVIAIPGHTHGSIALLDRQSGFLFSGDAINGQIWLQLEESTSLKTYTESLDALAPYRSAITELHTGHNIESVPPTFIDTMRSQVQQILDNNGAGDDDYQWFGGMAKRHMMGENSWILYTTDKL